MTERLHVGKTRINQPFFFYGCEIRLEHDGSIIMFTMRWYLERISNINLTHTRMKELQDKETKDDLKAYRSLAVTLLFWKCCTSSVCLRNAFDTTKTRIHAGAALSRCE